jgi:DNA modification methylase
MSLRNYKSVLVGELVKYEANSRTHSDEQIAKIVRSINEFGFTNPLLIDENNVIIAGHGRLAAALQIGLDEVPCIVLPGLTPAQKAALVIADNKIAVDAGWDTNILLEQFAFLKSFDYDLTLTGFDLDELCDIFPDEAPEVFCGEDDLPVAAEHRSCLGDIWLLGDHRLVCGDSTVSDDVLKLLAGQFPNTMITDPPYGVKYEANWRVKAGRSKGTAREANNKLENDDNADWYDAYVLFPGSVAYVWHASAFTDVVMANLRDAGFEVKQQIIWNKNVHALSRCDYHWKHEPCWYAVKKSGERNWKGGRTQMTVWDVPSIGSEKEKTAHPTQKPVELFIRSINHHTNPGEYVYDPFAGSGTLMVACEKTKRRALMMELDPKYCDIIIQRYENYSGKKAVREAKDGQNEIGENETPRA